MWFKKKNYDDDDDEKEEENKYTEVSLWYTREHNECEYEKCTFYSKDGQIPKKLA